MTIPNIPDDWTAREALVIYAFIDAIREAIWSRYGLELQEIFKADRSTYPDDWGSLENRKDFDGEADF